MTDAWRAYLEMALGLTETPRKKAQKAVGDLVSKGGATAVQLQGLVEDLMSAGVSNREALTNIVRYEVDRALGVVGLATAEEVSELTTRVRDLEKQLRAAQSQQPLAQQAPAQQAPASQAQSGVTPAVEPELGGDRLNKPAPLPAKVAKKAVAKKAVKAPPNQMPAAATLPAAPVKKTTPAPVKMTPSAPVKTTPSAPVRTMPSAPAGTAESPVAAVKEAAASTELPQPGKKAAGKKAAAKKTDPVKKTAAKKAPAPKPDPEF